MCFWVEEKCNIIGEYVCIYFFYKYLLVKAITLFRFSSQMYLSKLNLLHFIYIITIYISFYFDVEWDEIWAFLSLAKFFTIMLTSHNKMASKIWGKKLFLFSSFFDVFLRFIACKIQFDASLVSSIFCRQCLDIFLSIKSPVECEKNNDFIISFRSSSYVPFSQLSS